MDLRINQLYRDQDSNSLYRVIYANLEEDEAFLINVENKHTGPVKFSYAHCLRRIINNKLKKEEEDPYSFLSAILEENLSDKAKTDRDDRHRIIFGLISDIPIIAPIIKDMKKN